MKFSIQLGQYTVDINVGKTSTLQSGILLAGSNVSIQLPFSANKFYCHGWQSWSLTAWLDAKKEPLPSYPKILQVWQVDPLYTKEKKLNGSWVGGVDTPDGNIILLGALGLESHVKYDGRNLLGFYEHGDGEWFLAYGPEQEIFNNYAALLAEKFGRSNAIEPPRVWCSWYSLYKDINEGILLRILNDMDDLPFDVFQVDDGWQKKIGDWEANQKFPSGMQDLASNIKSAGKTAGLWLAPFLVVPSSNLYKNHPDWILRDCDGNFVRANVNWYEKVFALDTTHPQVINWLVELLQKVRSWGYDYIKLDFLFAGALPGCRYNDLPRETAYRQTLEKIRSALGDAFLLTCGAPIVPSIGLCDAIRVGADASEEWNLYIESRILNNFAVPGTQNGIRNTLNRMWLKTLVNIDPDVVFFSSHSNNLNNMQKILHRNLAHITNFKATSDLPSWLTKAEFEELNTFLELKPGIQEISPYKYQIDDLILDYSETIKMPEPLKWFEKTLQLIFRNFTNSSNVLILFDKYISAQRRRSFKYEIKTEK
jgi:alpha-galactosidase